MDPRKSGDFTSATMISLVFEGLTRCLPDGTSEPALAERIDVSEDLLTYTFHMRESFWTDGKPVTAYDFEKTWKQALDPEFPSVCAYLFYPIKNAENAVHQTVSLDEVGIEALDPLTLKVTLERPTPYFISLTAFPSFLPVPQHRLAEMDGIINSNRVVNGPFSIGKVTPHALIVLEKNKNYWNPSEQKLNEIQISIIGSESTAYSMFEKGELDWLGGILAPISPDALASTEVQEKAIYSPMSASTFFCFNVGAAPFSNKNIRKAFSLAVDRDEIAREILPNSQVPASRCLPPTLCDGENRDILPHYDPAAAQAYFHLGVQELGKPVEQVVLHFRGGVVDRNIAQVVQRKWEEVLGIEVQLVQTDFKTHKDFLHSRKYSVALANWVAQYHDPANILERFKNPSNAKNYSGWENLEFSSLIEEVQDELNPEIRTALIHRAEDLLAEDLPILPIYHWSSPSLCASRLHNVQTTPSGGVLFERSWVDAQ